jgi:hypothetical protein
MLFLTLSLAVLISCVPYLHVSASGNNPCGEDPWRLNPKTGICYAVGTKLLTWEEARAVCRRNYGELTSINSRSEEDFLFDLMRYHNTEFVFWTGGYYFKSNNQVYWSDRSRWTAYARWHDGFKLNGNCLLVTSKGWLLEDCRFKLPFVCKKPALW